MLSTCASQRFATLNISKRLLKNYPCNMHMHVGVNHAYTESAYKGEGKVLEYYVIVTKKTNPCTRIY